MIQSNIGSSWPAVLFWFALILVSGIAFFPALQGDFIFDDQDFIRDNTAVKEFRVLELLTSHTLTSFDSPSGLYRPLVTLSYSITHQIVGLNTFYYHLTNILLHIFCSLLVLFIAMKITGDRVKGYLAAIIFAAHPVHSEAICQITGREELLSSFFFLIALNLHLSFSLNYESKIKGKYLFLKQLGAGLAFFAALLSKEHTITFLLVALLIDFSLKSTNQGLKIQSEYKHNKNEGIVRRLLRFHWPYFLIAGVYLLIRWSVLGNMTINRLMASPPIPQPEWFFTSLFIFGKYVALFFGDFRFNYLYSFDCLPIIQPYSLAGFLVIVSLGIMIWIVLRNWIKNR